MSESEFDSTTTLCGPLPDTFTFADFEAVAVQGPVFVAPPVAALVPPEAVALPPVPTVPPAALPPVPTVPPLAPPPTPVRPPVGLLLPPVDGAPPVEAVLLPPTPAPPVAGGAPPVAWLTLVPPAPLMPPVAFAPPVAVVTGLLLVPPVGAAVEPPVAVAPPVPTGLAPPEALATPVPPPTPGDSESELPQPAAERTRASSAKAERGSFFMVDLLGLRPQSPGMRETGSEKARSRKICGSFGRGPTCGRVPPRQENSNGVQLSWLSSLRPASRLSRARLQRTVIARRTHVTERGRNASEQVEARRLARRRA